MKEYLLYVRKYSPFGKDYELIVYRVKTDNIYRIIGKMYCTSLEHIDRIDYVKNDKCHEDFWNERDIKIRDYKEPKLSEDR